MLSRKSAVRLQVIACLLAFSLLAVAGQASDLPDVIRVGKYEIKFDESTGEDTDGDGATDKISYFLDGSLVLTACDENGNGKADLWFVYDDEEYLIMEVCDLDGDGEPDEFTRLSREEEVVEITAAVEEEVPTDSKRATESKTGKDSAASAKVAEVVFEDDFNAEGGGRALNNYRDFKNWVVTEGEVDLLGHGYWDFYPDYGLYIDMDGTQRPKETAKAGTLESKQRFKLSPGTYRLSFDVAGNPLSGPNTLSVSLGVLYGEDIIIKKEAPFVTIMRLISVPSASEARLVFSHHGGDWEGILLDNVKLERVK